MKTIRDIEKLLGITRWSLQEYDKIGLLHPSARNQYGHILYDDEANSTYIYVFCRNN